MNFKDFRKPVPGETDGYFHLSGIREARKLRHHPFIVFKGDTVELCFSAEELVKFYPPETNVLGQWGGQWSSDFFHFTVGDLIRHIELIPKKEYYQV